MAMQWEAAMALPWHQAMQMAWVWFSSWLRVSISYGVCEVLALAPRKAS